MSDSSTYYSTGDVKYEKTSETVWDDGIFNHSAIGSNWQDVRKKIFTKEEILKSDKRVSRII